MTPDGIPRADLPTPAGLADRPIYLDYNATTPADPRVIEAMLPYLTTHFGNPSNGHHYAEQPRRALATARQQVACLIGAAPEEIVFAGSGSEADSLAIHGAVAAHARPSEVEVITQVTEHPAVLEACRALHRRYGTTVTYLPVGEDGRVNPQDLLAATPAIAASTGSACHAHSQEPSPVLLAMPRDRGQALSALRLSLGRWTTRRDVERAAEAIAMTADHLLAPRRRSMTGPRPPEVFGGSLCQPEFRPQPPPGRRRRPRQPRRPARCGSSVAWRTCLRAA